MVPAAGLDALGAVELLKQHHPGQVVREGHGGKGQAEIRLLLDGRVDAEGRADEKAGRALAGGLDLGQLCRQLDRKSVV